MNTVADIMDELIEEIIEFPEWLRCPYCGDEGTRDSLANSGHSCCQEYLLEIEEGK